MSSRRTWIWIVVIVLGLCVTAMMAVAGAGIYFATRGGGSSAPARRTR